MRSVITLLRIPFSWFLMPVFLFGISAVQHVNWELSIMLFVILHLLIYPASNAYNSYIDKDEESIGGVKHPPKATKQLFYVSLLMDIAGLAWAFFIGYTCFVMVLLYIAASKLYSYKNIRLKKYPWAGWFTVAIFQGAFINILIQLVNEQLEINYFAALACSFLVGGVYPLTQVYQHEADAKDGVKTLSMLLGYRGTFVFTIVMFTIAMVCLSFYFTQTNSMWHFVYLNVFMCPVTFYFFKWMQRVWMDTLHANFENAMAMNIIASSCLNACFGLLIYFNHFL